MKTKKEKKFKKNVYLCPICGKKHNKVTDLDSHLDWCYKPKNKNNYPLPLISG